MPATTSIKPANVPSHQQQMLRLLLPAVVIGLLIFVWGSSLTGPDTRQRAIDAVYVVLTSLPWTLLWLASAAGYGIIAGRFVRPAIELNGTLRLATGIALLLLIDAALGSLGMYQIGGTSAGAWIVIALGVIAWLWSLRRLAGQQLQFRPDTLPVVAVVIPGAALLLLAACSAVGWLWDSEFGGYDALSYHLQLPKEWCLHSAIAPFEHNVYSFLPGYMEATYYHLMVLRGDPIEAAYSCQMLHAAFALIAAMSVARLVRSLTQNASPQSPRLLVALGALLVLGTPWVIVTGSLAYNEMPGVLLLAAGLCLIVEKQGAAVARAALLGLFMAIAVGSKSTSAGFVALPLVATIIWLEPKRIKSLAAAAIVAFIALLPWLLRNYLHASNPTFPFLTSIFGTAHWSAEQTAIWNGAHHGPESLFTRFIDAIQQLFRYGIGANPDPTGHEPWQAQWSVLPWLAILGGLFASTSRQRRRPAFMLLLIIVLQLVFWVFFTHIKSRFMLPMVVPASALTVLGIARLSELIKPAQQKLYLVLISIAAIAWMGQPVILYSFQAGKAPAARIGEADLWSAQSLTAEEVAANAPLAPAVMINRALPVDARVLLVGDAAPLYYDQKKIVYCTVWDRGPMSRVIAEHPDDPVQWTIALKSDGFTHILLDPVMLSIWQQSAWADPALDPIVLQRAFDRNATMIASYPNGQRLYEIP